MTSRRIEKPSPQDNPHSSTPRWVWASSSLERRFIGTIVGWVDNHRRAASIDKTSAGNRFAIRLIWRQLTRRMRKKALFACRSTTQFFPNSPNFKSLASGLDLLVVVLHKSS